MQDKFKLAFDLILPFTRAQQTPNSTLNMDYSCRSLLTAAVCLVAITGGHCRIVLQAAAPEPTFAPAPTGSYNNVTGYSCPSPGSTGYLFQTAPCAYGDYAGELIYCDEPTEGGGIVGIRDADDDDCDTSADCETGYFCNVHLNGTCSAVAPTSCFAGAPAPAPAPVPAAASS